MENRRDFLKASAAAAASVGLGMPAVGAGSKSKKKLLKALKIGMLPGNLSDEEKFKLAARCGFDGIDGSPTHDHDAAERQADVARKAKCPIHGLVYGWWPPFDGRKQSVMDKAVKDMTNALQCAKVMGAETVLLVPTKVTETFGYAEAYEISQELVRKIIPVAEDTKVVIAIENVWSKFLLSPLEFARYLDELDSPWIRAYFDVGNVIIEGFAQHWVRILGNRIIKLDIKDFKRAGAQWVNVLDGDVNWKETRKALDEINFQGWMTAEVSGGDEAHLTDLANRMDKFIQGEA